MEICVAEATRGWDVSERTLRRRLATRSVDGAWKDELGQWRIPVEWLDAEFTKSAIDLRDAGVAEGLAEALGLVFERADLSAEAEVRAARAEAEAATGEARALRAEEDLKLLQISFTQTTEQLQDTRIQLAVAETQLEREIAARTADQSNHAERDGEYRAALSKTEERVDALQQELNELRTRLGDYRLRRRWMSRRQQTSA